MQIGEGTEWSCETKAGGWSMEAVKENSRWSQMGEGEGEGEG